eukprot:SAG31_NODE_438_length_15693_cov_6.254248_4_plen_195_part_00
MEEDQNAWAAEAKRIKAETKRRLQARNLQPLEPPIGLKPLNVRPFQFPIGTKIPEDAKAREAFIAEQVERLASDGLAQERNTILRTAQAEAARRMREREAELLRQEEQIRRIREAVTASLSNGQWTNVSARAVSHRPDDAREDENGSVESEEEKERRKLRDQARGVHLSPSMRRIRLHIRPVLTLEWKIRNDCR